MPEAHEPLPGDPTVIDPDGPWGAAAHSDELEGTLQRWRDELLAAVSHNHLLTMAGSTLVLDGIAGPDALERAARLLAEGSADVEQLVGTEPATVRQVEELGRRGRTVELERGIDPLHLVLGTIECELPDRPALRAPVIAVPIRVIDRGRWQAPEVEVRGPAITNPVLRAIFDRDRRGGETELAIEPTAAGIVRAVQERAAAILPAELAPSATIHATVALAILQTPRSATIAEFADPPGCYLRSDLVRAIAGEPAARRRVAESSSEEPLETSAGRRSLPLVLDADSTQLAAIHAALDGQHLVIEGPPGTGKSQTIANLIVALAGAGKRVLFVTEKRPAVDAVLDRLRALDLDDAVLDLQSAKATSASVARRVLDAVDRAIGHRAPAPAPDLLSADLEDLEDQIRLFHTPIEGTDATIFTLQQDVAGTAAECEQAAQLHPMVPRLGPAAGTASLALRSASEDALCRWVELDGSGLAASNPVFDHLLDTNALATPSRADLAARTFPAVRSTFAAASDAARRAADAIGRAPGRSVAEWHHLSHAVTQVASAFAPWLPATFSDPALVASVQGLVDRPGTAALRMALQADQRRAAELLAEHHPVAVTRQQLLTDARLAFAARHLPGPDWDGTVPTTEADELRSALGELEAAIAAASPLLDRELLHTVDAAMLLEGFEAFDREPGLLSRVEELCRAWSALGQIGFDGVAADLIATVGTDDLALRRGLRHLVALARLDHGHQMLPAAKRFDRLTLELRARQLAGAYPAHLRANRTNAQAQHQERARLASRKTVELQDLEAVVRERRRDVTLRQLFDRAAELVLEVTPCLALSPRQVPEVLPGRELFDVVVFDEASQVRPRDAVPALARAATCIVVGDSKQLPPTAFFDAADLGDSGAIPDPAQLESVLDAVASLLPAQRRRHLRWHYRSADPRLIAFSNDAPELYQGALTVTPSPRVDPLALRHVVATTTTVVDTAVAEVLAFAALHPDQSILIIATSVAGAQQIDRALRAALESRPDLDARFTDAASEPVVVKNLERVQGDERDAVFLVLDWARTPAGEVSHNFGPISQQGGERRLNVALTRARRTMVVVTGFSTDELDPERLTSTGARLLADYLRWVDAGGPLAASAPDGGADGDPLIRDLERAVTSAGGHLEVAPQSGRHPLSCFVGEDPDHLRLAVDHNRLDLANLDGVDLVVLRPDLLRSRGWIPVQSWSSDLLADPAAVADRLLQAAREGAPDGTTPNAATTVDSGRDAARRSTQAEPPASLATAPGRWVPRPDLDDPDHDPAVDEQGDHDVAANDSVADDSGRPPTA